MKRRHTKSSVESCSANCRAVCLSVYTHYIPSEPLSQGCTLSTALAHATLPFPLSAPQPCHCTKSTPMTQFTAFRIFPHFKLCKEFGGLNPRRNQRPPKAALLHRACCANAHLLFRNSSRTISRYLKVTTQFQQWTTHSREVLRRTRARSALWGITRHVWKSDANCLFPGLN